MVIVTQEGPVKNIYVCVCVCVYMNSSPCEAPILVEEDKINFKSIDYVKWWSLQRRKVVIQQEAGHTNPCRPGYRFWPHSREQQEATEWFEQEKVMMT